MILMRYPFRVFWERVNKPAFFHVFSGSIDQWVIFSVAGGWRIDQFFGWHLTYWPGWKPNHELNGIVPCFPKVSQYSKTLNWKWQLAVGDSFSDAPSFGGSNVWKKIAYQWDDTIYIYYTILYYIYIHTCDLILVANHSSEFSDNDNRALAMVWVVVGNGVVVVYKQILEYGIWNQNMLQANVNK